MNPIKITLITLGGWIILTLICVFTIEDVSEKPFTVAIYSFYLAPLICILSLIISSLFYCSWVKNNKTGFLIFLILLVIWLLGIVFYIKSLFI